MSVNIFRMTVSVLFALICTAESVHAQSLFGSGAMQGGMVCPYPQQTSRAAVSMSDDERDARQRVTRITAQQTENTRKKDRAQDTVDRLRPRIERYFDSTVSEFLLDTHIEGLRQCSQYRTASTNCGGAPAPAPPAEGAPPIPAPAPSVDCAALVEPPALLAGKWTERTGNRGNYCVGNSRANAGGVSAQAICGDDALRSEERRTVNVSQCARALTDYRKARIELAAAADREEQLEDDMLSARDSIADAQADAASARARNTEAGCEDCDNNSRGYSYQRRRDWGSTVSNVVGGLALMYVGRQAERSAQEQAAQLGVPSDSSYGYPFYRAGFAGVINGLTGPGAYGCASTTGGGGFGQNGVMGPNGMMNGANGAFGPFAAGGGAFSYPQNMFASPLNGGAFNPGFNINGGFNGPGGGSLGNGGFPYNGNMAMCITFPCNTGGNGLQGNFNIGGGLNGGFNGGYDPYNQQFGLNGGQYSAQYQLQMLQQQQQQQQQYYAQQQQYYQMQYQQQMAYYQQQQQRQQQASAIQQQIQQLNAQLQQIYYTNGGGVGGGGYIGAGGGLQAGFSLNLGGSLNGGGGLPGGYTNGGIIGNPGFNNPGLNNPGMINPGINPMNPTNPNGGSRGR